jgi:hypothetical protein
MSKPNVIIINPKDNVAIALEEIGEGKTVRLPDGGTMTAAAAIPYSHKVALHDIPGRRKHHQIRRDDRQGNASICKGHWVHTHNLDIDNKR